MLPAVSIIRHEHPLALLLPKYCEGWAHVTCILPTVNIIKGEHPVTKVLPTVSIMKDGHSVAFMLPTVRIMRVSNLNAPSGEHCQKMSIVLPSWSMQCHGVSSIYVMLYLYLCHWMLQCYRRCWLGKGSTLLHWILLFFMLRSERFAMTCLLNRFKHCDIWNEE